MLRLLSILCVALLVLGDARRLMQKEKEKIWVPQWLRRIGNEVWFLGRHKRCTRHYFADSSNCASFSSCLDELTEILTDDQEQPDHEDAMGFNNLMAYTKLMYSSTFHEDKEISKWQYCTNPPAKEKAYFRTLEARTEKELEKVEKEDTMFYTRSEEEMKMIAQERAAEEMAANGESPYYISSGNPIESIWEFAENVRRNLMFTKAWRKVTVADGENVSEHWEQKEGALPFDLTLFRFWRTKIEHSVLQYGNERGIVVTNDAAYRSLTICLDLIEKYLVKRKEEYGDEVKAVYDKAEAAKMKEQIRKAEEERKKDDDDDDDASKGDEEMGVLLGYIDEAIDLADTVSTEEQTKRDAEVAATADTKEDQEYMERMRQAYG